MTNLAIAATGLRKSYGDTVVLDGVDFAVPEGTIFSLLGPNGAGKTTAVKILSTLVPPDPASGGIRVGGHDLATDAQAVRAAIGVTGQFSAVDGLITGEENMLLMADLHHLSRGEGRRTAAELLERFDLTDAAKKPASTYSGGMKRRLDLAMTLVGNPRIIFLDEPTTGLDPRSRHNMWQIIRKLVSEGATVFLTTQYLNEADELADRIAVLNDGKLVAQGTAEELKRLIPGGHVRLRFTDPASYQSAGLALRDATRDDESLALQIPSDGSQRELRSILDWLDFAGVEADELTVHTPDLDDVFFALTGGRRPQPDQGDRPMSSLSLAVRDSSTMLRRNLLHARRYPSLTLNLLLTPIMLLLLFVYIFGDAISAGIGGGDAVRSDYIAYVVPGLLLMTIGSTVVGTAVSVSNDMTEGIIARFRTMAIHRGSVLVGHVVGSVLQSIMSVTLVGAVAVAIGFRSTDATAFEWLAAFGLLVIFALALTWIAVGMGLISPNAEAASNNAMPLILLPLLSSAFVPVDSMPGWFQPIAEYQPFTPAIETLRGLLLGSEMGHNGWLAVVWCLGLAVLGYFWSTSKFNRDPK